MYSEAEARERFLNWINKPEVVENGKTFHVTYTMLSKCGEYWVIRGEAIDPMQRGAGISGYLLNNLTGEISYYSHEPTPEDFLKDLYDEREADGKYYVLCCGFSSSDKRQLLNLRKKLNILPRQAVYLVKAKPIWFYGIKRHLIELQGYLENIGISSEIRLVNDVTEIEKIDYNHLTWDRVLSKLKGLCG